VGKLPELPMKVLATVFGFVLLPAILTGAQSPQRPNMPDYQKAISDRNDWLPALQSPEGLKDSYFKQLADDLAKSPAPTAKAAIALVIKNKFGESTTIADGQVTALFRLTGNDTIFGKPDDLVWEVRIVPERQGGEIAGVAWVGAATGKIKVLFASSTTPTSLDQLVQPAATIKPADANPGGSPAKESAVQATPKPPVELPDYAKALAKGDWRLALSDSEALKISSYKVLAEKLAQGRLPNEKKAVNAATSYLMNGGGGLPDNGRLVVTALLCLAQPDARLGAKGDLVWEVQQSAGGVQEVFWLSAATGKMAIIYLPGRRFAPQK